MTVLIALAAFALGFVTGAVMLAGHLDKTIVAHGHKWEELLRLLRD